MDATKQSVIAEDYSDEEELTENVTLIEEDSTESFALSEEELTQNVKSNEKEHVTAQNVFVINNSGAGYSTLSEAIRAASSGDTIYVTANADVNESVTISKNITLDLNGNTLTYKKSNTKDPMIKVTNGKFTLKDSADNGKIVGSKSKRSLIYITGSKSSMDIQGGTITGHTVTNDTSSTWSNNLPCAGAITLYDGSTFTMSGGTISYCETQMKRSWFSTNNNGSGSGYDVGSGGAVAAIKSCKVTISGGVITHNKAARQGGGIFVEGSDLVMTGGEISYNECQLEGGGICIGYKWGYRGATGTISGGKIIYNTAGSDQTLGYWGGGGISVHGYTDDTAQTLTLINAVVRNNTADGFGGGFAGCPFSTNYLVSGKDAAIAVFDNTAKGISWSKNKDDSATPEDDIAMEAHKAGKFEIFDDIYIARDGTNNGYMLGGGDAKYVGQALTKTKSPYESSAIEISGTDSVKTEYQYGLVSKVSDEYKDAANKVIDDGKNGVLIAYNHSYVHGGGVLNNSTAMVGPDTPTPDKNFPVSFKKFKEDGKTLLAGAELEIYNSDNELVTSWTSDTVAHSQMLVPGTYTLKEKNPPKGYGTADDITFTIDSSGKVKINKKEVTDVTMTDEPASYGKLKITKTIKGDVTEEEAEGALTFKVTGPGNYEEDFTLSDFTHQEGT
ncbi:MAG: prealbumin-like fold domain-containing protein, partial [Erysipelotrichaceae bacterium]|nr:prealbumin-like fold domain-containing protein [Erysipelotrichaceae bacterium]